MEIYNATLADAGVRFVPNTSAPAVSVSGVISVFEPAPTTHSEVAMRGSGRTGGQRILAKTYVCKQGTTSSNGTTDPGRETWSPPV